MNKLYYKSPISLQHIYISLDGLAYKLAKEGKKFRILLNELENSQYFSEDKQREMQNEQLRIMVQHCYENVPYYYELFNNHSLKPSDIKNQEDLYKIPFTTKEDVQKYPDKFIAKNVKKRLTRKATTSGTTGTPLTLHRDLNSIVFENAAIWRQYRWAGINPGDRIVSIRGKMIQKIDNLSPPYWRYNYVQNRMIMSSYHITHQSALDYYKALISFQPKAIEAYPSSIFNLAQHFIELGLDKIKLEAIFTSSETLYDHQRNVLSDFFQCNIYDLYGNAERVTAIGSCKEGNYHIFSEYGICEFADRLINDLQYKEIIGTSLNNYAMPLLRYSTGDRAYLFEHHKKCNCGIHLPIIKDVESQRIDEFILTPDGRQLQSIEQLSEGIDNIIECQLVQEKRDLVIIKIIPTENYSKVNEEKLINNARERLGYKIDIKVEKVPSIPRTSRGKCKYIINNVKKNAN